MGGSSNIRINSGAVHDVPVMSSIESPAGVMWHRGSPEEDVYSLLHAHRRVGHAVRADADGTGAGAGAGGAANVSARSPSLPPPPTPLIHPVDGTRLMGTWESSSSGQAAVAPRRSDAAVLPAHARAEEGRVQEDVHTTVGDMLDEASRSAEWPPGTANVNVARQTVGRRDATETAADEVMIVTGHLIQQVAIALANAIRAVQTAQKRLMF